MLAWIEYWKSVTACYFSLLLLHKFGHDVKVVVRRLIVYVVSVSSFCSVSCEWVSTRVAIKAKGAITRCLMSFVERKVQNQ